MDPTFGARLRQQRERQQVTLSAIAEHTKIKLPLLEGLERDDLSHWPGGIYRRSYVRDYAQAIGLDPEAIVREFLTVYPPDPNEEMAEVVSARVTGTSRRPPTRLQYLIGSALEAIPALRPKAAATVAPVAEAVAAPPTVAIEPQEMPSEPPVVATHAPILVAPAPEPEPLPEPQPQVEPESEPEPAASAPAPSVDLHGVADLCLQLSRAADQCDVSRVLEQAAHMLGAVGLLVWGWDSRGRALRPQLGCGYSSDTLALLPSVRVDAENAVARAFRSEQTRIVSGDALATGAVAVPLVTPSGCAGVLALEFRGGGEQHDQTRAVIAILAAQMSTLVACPPVIQAATA